MTFKFLSLKIWNWFFLKFTDTCEVEEFRRTVITKNSSWLSCIKINLSHLDIFQLTYLFRIFSFFFQFRCIYIFVENSWKIKGGKKTCINWCFLCSSFFCFVVGGLFVLFFTRLYVWFYLILHLLFFTFENTYLKWAVCPTWSLTLEPWDGELHAYAPTEPVRYHWFYLV